MGMFDGDNGGIMGMLSGMFGQGGATDPNAPLNIQSPAQQAGPSFLDQIKAGMAKDPNALSNMAMQFANKKPAAPPVLQPMNIPQAQRPQVYGSMMPTVGR